jgi:ribulose-5-phosphate 4-epimerase/fuculose-1-phosphate aldolase
MKHQNFKKERKEVARFMRRLYNQGLTLLSAFGKPEVLENAAKMTLIVDLTGKKKALSGARLREIENIFR